MNGGFHIKAYRKMKRNQGNFCPFHQTISHTPKYISKTVIGCSVVSIAATGLRDVRNNHRFISFESCNAVKNKRTTENQLHPSLLLEHPILSSKPFHCTFHAP